MAVPALDAVGPHGDRRRRSPGWCFALVLVRGSCIAIDNPARQAFVMELVGPERVVNAVALNSVVVHCARIVGPALAGAVIAAVRRRALLRASTRSRSCAMLVALRRMDPRGAADASAARRATRASCARRSRYVRATPELWIPLARWSLVGTFSFNFQVLLPLLASSTWHGTATDLRGADDRDGRRLGRAARSRPGARPRLAAAARRRGRACSASSSCSPRSRPRCRSRSLALVPLGAVSVTFAAGVNSSLQLARRRRCAGA